MMDHVTDLASRCLVLIEGGPPSTFSAWSPDAPGCVATGTTLDEVEARMRDALVLHLQGLADDGLELPHASGPGVYVQRARSAA